MYSKLIGILISRPVRLSLLTIFVGIIFPSIRLSAFGLVFLILLYYSFKSYRLQKTPYFSIIMAMSLISAILHSYSYYNYLQVKKYIEENSPLSTAMVSDGDYVGTGEGLRGPIKLMVSVRNHKIGAIKIIHYQDIVNGLDEIRNRIEGENIYLHEDFPKTAFGIIKTASGYQAAILDALWQGVKEKPTLKPLTKFTYSLIENYFGSVTFNSMAIIFIIILTFDYFLQPVLMKDTGQSLNCYNCQVCVGACPVKMVDGQPFPMTMVLAARLGDYAKVAQMAHYCVGCGKCAVKCPIGNSSPNLVAACIIASRDKKKGRNLSS